VPAGGTGLSLPAMEDHGRLVWGHWGTMRLWDRVLLGFVALGKMPPYTSPHAWQGGLSSVWAQVGVSQE
jgi:hypothetical protein